MGRGEGLPTGRAMRGPRGWRGPAALLASIVATLLLCELVARRFPPPRYFALWQWDPIVGHAPIPSFKTSIDWWVSEGLPVIHYETNGWGFRDREFSAARRPGVSRVLVLGDSFAEAAEVEANERFSARLEE